MPFCFECRAKRGVVVDLAVEGNPHAAVLVGHRLLAGRADVDDRKPSVRQTDRSVDELAAAVGAAMAHYIAHPAKPIDVNGLTRVEVNNSGESAHKVYRSLDRKMS